MLICLIWIASPLSTATHSKFMIWLCSKPRAFCFEGAQSDSEVSSSYHPSDMSLDRGYTSDSEVYADHGKPGKMHRSVTDVDVMNSGWLVVSSQWASGA